MRLIPLSTLRLGTLLCALFLAAQARPVDLPGQGADAGKAVVYRDTWGVPHIYAPDMESGLYAMGWAQAQDRPVELLKNLKRGLGELASVEGKGGINSDRVAHMWRLYDSCKEDADKVRPDIRKQVQAFVRGINDYYAEHAEDVPEWWGSRQVDEFMVGAFGRLFLQNWSFDDGFDDLKRGGVEPGTDERVQRGSNQFAVSPQRSAEKVPILYIDPHLGWSGASRFWEFRVHAGDWHGSGFSLAGIPYVGLGHNADMAWAMTTGGPDTADCFELTVNPDNPMQYKYDDGWRDFAIRKVTLTVKDSDPETVTLVDSHHGPVVAFKGGKAYAIHSAYVDAVQGNEAWYEFIMAKDYTGAVRAMATQQLFPQNVMVADTSGNIYYQRTGRVPKRVEGYDWSKPVDGSTSKTEWLGLHESSDHLQVLNPPQGFMQNCNIPPDAMMPDSPFSLAKTIPYLFADLSHGNRRDGWSNSRGARAVELLAADDSVTVEEALAYAVDTKVFGADRWVEILRMANSKFGSALRNNAAHARALDDLLQWNNRLDVVSTGALKYYYWRRQLNTDYPDEMPAAVAKVDNYRASLGEPSPPLDFNDEELQAALDSFGRAMDALQSELGSLDKTYGDVFRVGRDADSWPVAGGGDSDKGMTTLRNVKYGREKDDHTRWGQSGQTSTQIVVLTKPIKSWTFVPWGQSDRENSPHFDDQAEMAFSPAKLKESWWMPEDLVQHVESRTELPKAK
ncbi:MAG: 7-beta-(4-carbaxybutanamido)cephalosporanic acid acylase [Candidatus Hydrogenedentota bacterium]